MHTLTQTILSPQKRLEYLGYQLSAFLLINRIRRMSVVSCLCKLRGGSSLPQRIRKV